MGRNPERFRGGRSGDEESEAGMKDQRSRSHTNPASQTTGHQTSNITAPNRIALVPFGQPPTTGIHALNVLVVGSSANSSLPPP